MTDTDDEDHFDTFEEDFALVVSTAISLKFMRVLDHKDRLVHPNHPWLVALLRFYPVLRVPVSRSFMHLSAPNHRRKLLLDLVTVSYYDLERFILGKFGISAALFKHALSTSIRNDASGHGAPKTKHDMRSLLDLAIDATGRTLAAGERHRA